MVSYALSLCRLSTGCKINRFIHLQRALLAVQLCLCGLILLLLLASSFPSFLFTLKRCEPLEINPSHWSERHIGICFTSFTCFATYWMVTTYVAKHILDGYHVCGETLVRCDSLVSDPSHWGDNAPQCSTLLHNAPHCSTVSSTELNLTQLYWTLTEL